MPGDAHSECCHPAATLIRGLTAAATAHAEAAHPDASEVRIEFEDGDAPAISLVLLAHGVRNNWATWPLNFDPIWLKSCTGHTLPERAT